MLELIAIILTVAILAILLWLSSTAPKRNARDQRRLADANALSAALELYKQNNNHKYPDSLTPGTPLQDARDTYLAEMPHDPSFSGDTTTDYYYKQTDCGNGYTFYFSLEGAQNNLQPGLAMETQGGQIGHCDDACRANQFLPWQPATCADTGAICGTINDGCGKIITCGSCAPGTACSADQKICNCVPDCSGKVCGPDGCGGLCGSGCQTGYTCFAGACTDECPPDVCGDCSNVACGQTCTTHVSRDNATTTETYDSVNICGSGNQHCQCWLTKNINVGAVLGDDFNVGPAVNPMKDMDANTSLSRYCYNNDCADYGGLYTWAMAMYEPAMYNSHILPVDKYTNSGINARRQGICPHGYHIPSDREWAILENNLDSSVGPTLGDGATCSLNNWGYNADVTNCYNTNVVYDSQTYSGHGSYGAGAGTNIFSALSFYPGTLNSQAILTDSCLDSMFNSHCEFLMSASQVNSGAFWGHLFYNGWGKPYRFRLSKIGEGSGDDYMLGVMTVRCIKDN